MMKLSVALWLAIAVAAPAIAQDATPKGSAEAAKAKNSMCIGCHGVAGYRTAFPDVYQVPKIGGQSPTYIVKALEAYKSGDRSHPSMQGIARSLTPQDMADLAAYYGGAK
ncbi:MAG: cytochrome c [Betaproteobacteria bacterium]|jgi:cytochrome c553|nr:cytochrome c [Betaproteobacteria bacterium]